VGGKTSGRSAAAAAAAAVEALGRDVRQVEGSAHHGDHVTDAHEQMHLPESLVDGHVVRAVDQRAQVVVAHFVADARRLLDCRLDGDESQQRRHHVQPDHQFQQEAQAQHEQLSGKIHAKNAIIFVIVNYHIIIIFASYMYHTMSTYNVPGVV